MPEESAVRPSWSVRNALWLVGAAPIVAGILGSAFNIWFNLLHVVPLLSSAQHADLERSIAIYNVIVYPIGVGTWFWIVYSIRKPFGALVRGEEPDAKALARARTRSINLPWYISGIMLLAWGLCVPVFRGAVAAGGGAVHADFALHLTISLAIGGLITITHGFIATELIVQKLVFPTLFRDARPADTPGTITLTLSRRAFMWAISVGACPIATLVLLGLVHDAGPQTRTFMAVVGALGVAFGLGSSWLMCKLIAEPVIALRDASTAVGRGDLDVHVDLLRADEFGPLIDEFNQMVVEMRNKEQLQRTFGLHVGEAAAKQILEHDPGLGGREEHVTVMFCDIRNFTARCGKAAAAEVVTVLNTFLTTMVEIVEGRHGGMVNKYLGDGFMAIFGAGGEGGDGHARAALAAGRDMLAGLDAVNARVCADGNEQLGIGIGLHTGPAIVGNVGSEARLEYTAIGDTVNMASRVEGLTKDAGVPLLFTDATAQHVGGEHALRSMGERIVKGREEPLTVFTVA
jgi:adenylate cyclase